MNDENEPVPLNLSDLPIDETLTVWNYNTGGRYLGMFKITATGAREITGVKIDQYGSRVEVKR
jgi:hypothetical protein